MRSILLLLACVRVCESYPNGQVSSSCDDLVPSHGSPAQTSAPPYTVTADTSGYKQGDTITEARQVGGNSAVGSFSLVGSDSQLLTCSGVSVSFL
ncbi:putative ferric-chelate reductase 1 isoform X2, partial [Clarias magur]